VPDPMASNSSLRRQHRLLADHCGRHVCGGGVAGLRGASAQLEDLFDQAAREAEEAIAAQVREQHQQGLSP
jgi:hypothetical protein